MFIDPSQLEQLKPKTNCLILRASTKNYHRIVILENC